MWRLLTRKNQKAVLTNEGKPIFGEIKSVDSSKESGKVLVTMHTQTGETTTFDMIKKLAADGFKLISDDVYEEQMKKRLAEIRRHSIVETLILSGQHKGIWIKAEVWRVEESTMDMTVLFPRKWNVAGTAVAVPYQFIRAVSDNEVENYSIPVEFTLDDSVICVSCNDQMEVSDLQWAIHKARRFPFNQIYFLHEGVWLSSSDAIPNSRIFCIVNREGRLTDNQIDLASALKRRKSANSSASTTSTKVSLKRVCSAGSTTSTETSSVMGRSDLSSDYSQSSMISKMI